MKVAGWSTSTEVKELLCGNKMIVVQCSQMSTCPLWVCDVYAWPELP